MTTDERTLDTGLDRRAPEAPPPNASGRWGVRESDATRHLCASAHLDDLRALVAALRSKRPSFRRMVREAAGANPYRAIGTSPAVELAPVLLHLRAARARTTVRDAVLTALLVMLAVGLVLSTRPIELVVVAVGMLALAWEVVYLERSVSRGIVARLLLKDAANDEVASDRRGDGRLAAVEEAERGDITVYRGFSPFVGSGEELGGWSFAVDIERGRSDFGESVTPEAFTLGELYAHVTESLERLEIAGLSIDDQIHVDGREIRYDERFLQQQLARPRTRADTELMSSVVAGADEHVRHYKRIRVVAWRGELVLSVFLRFALVRGNLFAEVNRLVLPPLDRMYRRADSVERAPTLHHKVRLAMSSLIGTPIAWILAPARLVATLVEPYSRWRERQRWRHEVRYNPAFDYGAEHSLREQAASKQLDQYFQVLDSHMYLKVLERQLLDAIVGFLDDHDIDTSELKERENAILNNGVIVAGGSVTADSLAVGNHARATSSDATAGARRRGGGKGTGT